MSTPLPSRPNFEHLRNEARDLLKAYTSGNPACCDVLRGLRRFTGAADATIMKEEVTLQEVQCAVAIKYGCRNWSELRDAGAAAGGAVEKPAEAAPPSPAVGAERMAALERIVAGGPASAWPLRQVIEFFKAATAMARFGGLIAIEHVSERLDDSFLKLGMRIVTDGTDASIVRNILLERKRTVLADHDRRLDMTMAGINAIATGDSPMIVDARLRAFLPAEAETEDAGRNGRAPVDLPGRLAALEAVIARSPASRWTAEDLIGFFTAAARVAQAGKLVALDGVAARTNDPLIRTGLQLVVDGADAEIVRSILVERKRTLVADLERRLDLIIAGVNGIAWGENPAVFETRGNAFLPAETGPAAA